MQAHQLVAVADELTQLSHRRRRDPSFGEFVQAHAVEQLLAVPVVVLHPAVAPLEPGGVHQSDLGAEALQDVDGPVPAIGRFDGHVRLRAGVGHRHRVVVDAHDAHLVAAFVFPHDQ